MDIKERLSFFQEMVQCEYPLHLWHYSPEFELIETDCPAELMLPDIISMLGFSSLVLAHIESGNRMPLILDTEFGLLWIAGFEYQGFALQQIHIVGPAFTGSNSHLVLRKKLDSYQLTVKLRSKIVKQIESVPIIPSSVLLSYAIGVAHPVSVLVETFGTGKVDDGKLEEAVEKVFDLRPTAIIRDLDLRRPIYRQLAAYGHMGREDLGVTWEKTDRVDALLAALK